LDYSVPLIQASSGLRNLMVESKKEGMIKESLVAQIAAYVYYNVEVISKLTSNTSFQNKFKEVIFNQIEKDFGEFVDSQARIKPKSLHHVYEWKKVGEADARLFKLNKFNTQALGFSMTYEFLPSKTFASSSGNRRHVFVNKASVMEAGMPLKIAPRYSKRLVFESNGITVFMPENASVVVRRPGGVSVKNSFKMTYSRFFKSNLVNLSIKKSGFQRLFSTSMMKALRLPSDIKRVKYTFNANTISLQADAALTSAFGASL
jgi:hypothetical protein